AGGLGGGGRARRCAAGLRGGGRAPRCAAGWLSSACGEVVWPEAAGWRAGAGHATPAAHRGRGPWGVTLACGVGVGARGGARAPARVRGRTLGGHARLRRGGGGRGGGAGPRAHGGGPRGGAAVGGVASWVYVLRRRS